MSTLEDEVTLLRRIPLFSAIDPGKLKLLAFASDRQVFHDGQTVFKQGDVGDAAYVVVSGIADVIVSIGGNDVSVAKLSENDFIGEIAILCDMPRTATIKAEGELDTLKIKKEHFLGLIEDAPQLGIEVMRELALRLSKTTAELSEARQQLKSQSS
ncbi:MAG: cyclic nucleotide-binding domain-containing protein [Rhizobiaceae bacterium]|nr:cyclic nucleotide-binding domain-containing protein [Rhizobiaceae bacterium]MBL4695160.1 cyclic nucleotide-binding domain-containing protein [Rhizobiaceae bacterium]MBL4732994.1 cyclic nucleotide-binding domain-containing protein [Rhizobiaceae bacterium]